MTLTPEPPPNLSTLTSPPSNGAVAAADSYQPCDDCGAALDDRQRYCIVCGARRKHADDPAARFLTAATRRRRASAAAAGSSAASRRTNGVPLAVVAGIAAIPIALGAGVLIGRSSAGGDGKLIAALRAQKAPVISYGGTAASASSGSGGGSSASTSVSNTFTADHGWVVQLAAVPAAGGASAITHDEQVDRGKGATKVGVIAGSGHTLSPSPPSGDVVIYSGPYPSRASAQKALAKLHSTFPHATVVKVSSSTSASASGGGKVLTKTKYGSATKASGYKATQKATAQGKSVASKDSHATGKNASGAGLPTVVSIP